MRCPVDETVLQMTERQGVEIARTKGRYTGRKADGVQHRRIIAFREAGHSIAQTAELAGCSTAQVKRVMALRKAAARAKAGAEEPA